MKKNAYVPYVPYVLPYYLVLILVLIINVLYVPSERDPCLVYSTS